MKKRNFRIILVIAILLLLPNVVKAEADVKLWINGNYVESDVAPFIENGRTLVPVRVISETLGFNVLWGEEEQKVIIYADGSEGTDNALMLIIGDTNAYFGTEDVLVMDVAPKIVNSRTFVPIRFIAETFKLKVDWDNDNNTVVIGEGYVAPEAKTQTETKNSNIPGKAVKYVCKVIDGDTIIINYKGREEKVRMIGVDTPEPSYNNTNGTPQGNTALDFTKSYLDGKEAYVEFDIERKDKYGRILGYVWLTDGTLFNSLLLEKGMAKVLNIPPNVKYSEIFNAAETKAKENKLGFWADDFFVNYSPSDYSKAPIGIINNNLASNFYDNLTESPYSDRLIKGNINSKGEKIYHCPGQRDYKKTVIDESQGERWFATEEEAIAAGWRKALR